MWQPAVPSFGSREIALHATSKQPDNRPLSCVQRKVTTAASASTATTELEWNALADPDFWGAQVQGLLATAYSVALKAVYALVVLIVGWILIKIVLWIVGKLMGRANVDAAVKSFMLSLLSFFLWMILWLQIFKICEIPNTSFTAVMSALAFAVGMAFSGIMNNLLAGLVLMTTKPFLVGDFVTGGGAEGVVKEITLTHTIVMTGDNKRQIVPNLGLATGTLVNASRNPTRRVDMQFGVAHEADLDDTRKMLRKILKDHPLVLKDPAFTVEPLGFTAHSVTWIVRPWCKTSDYWAVHFDVHEAVKKRTEELGISLPCPQQDAHLFKHSDTLFPAPAAAAAAAAATTTTDAAVPAAAAAAAPAPEQAAAATDSKKTK